MSMITKMGAILGNLSSKKMFSISRDTLVLVLISLYWPQASFSASTQAVAKVKTTSFWIVIEIGTIAVYSGDSTT